MSLIWTPPPRKIWTPSRKLQRGFIGLPGGMGAAFPSGGGGPPPLSTDIKWYLRGEGTNGQTTTEDSSTFARATTMSGGAQISTAQKTCGVSSILLDGVNDYVSTAVSTDFQVGNGNHWMRFKFRLNSLHNGCIFWYGNDGNFFNSVYCGVASNGSFYYGIYGPSSGSSIGTSPSVLSTDVWYEGLVGRQDDEHFMALDGVFLPPVATTISVGIPDVSPTVQLGAWYGDTYRQAWFNGFIDEFQFAKGDMPYTTDYSPASCFY